MNDQPAFSPFATQPPPAPMFDLADTGQAPKKGRGRKKHRVAAEMRATKKAAEPASPRLQTPTKRKARVTRPPKFELGALQAFAGLKEADAKLLANLVAGLSTVNKKSRAKIVAALGKVFT
jgi:hypothetical protein